jgi:hypothetical protein
MDSKDSDDGHYTWKNDVFELCPSSDIYMKHDVSKTNLFPSSTEMMILLRPIPQDYFL